MALPKPVPVVRFIVIHCSATPASMDVGVKEIDRWHREKGWWTCGYHYVIRRDGTIEESRRFNEDGDPIIGAHALGFNSESIGICLVGGVRRKDNKDEQGWEGAIPEHNFTPAQAKALRKLLSNLEENYPKALIIGHNDLPWVTKKCPVFCVKEFRGKCPLKR